MVLTPMVGWFPYGPRRRTDHGCLLANGLERSVQISVHLVDQMTFNLGGGPMVSLGPFILELRTATAAVATIFRWQIWDPL